MDKNEIRTNFIDNVNNLIYERRESQADVVRGTGISQSRMSILLTNQAASKTAIPTVEQLKALADYFDVSMDWLIENHNGDKTDKKTNEVAETKPTTYEDVIKALFLIDEFCDLGFGSVAVYGDDGVFLQHEHVHGISFHDNAEGHLHIVEYHTTDKVRERRDNLEKFVAEWHKVKKACSEIEDKQTTDLIYKTWKDGKIDDCFLCDYDGSPFFR